MGCTKSKTAAEDPIPVIKPQPKIDDKATIENEPIVPPPV